MQNPWFNAIITEEERREIDTFVYAISYRLMLGRIVCQELPKIIDQRFGDA
jgi:hypothetical protein